MNGYTFSCDTFIKCSCIKHYVYILSMPQCQKYKLITRKQEREVMLLSRRSSMINYKTDFLRSNGMSSLYRINIDPSIYAVMCRWQHLF